MLQELYEEASKHHRVARGHSKKENSLLYKGFKISHDLESGDYRILDTRKTDLYSAVTKEDTRMLKEHGFIKGCDLIMRSRDLKRVANFTKRLERLYTQKQEFKKDEKKFSKKLGICLAAIADNIDLLFFHKSRITQSINKYEGSEPHDQKSEKQSSS